MHPREALEAYLQELDTRLFSIYTIAKSALNEIQDRWCSHWPEGNDHGAGHINRVLDNLAILVGNNPVETGELSKLDVFLSMMGVVAHDIGMINGRAQHASKSAKLIEQIAANNQYMFDAHILEILIVAIVCHSSSVSIEDECSGFAPKETIAGQSVQPSKIAALVRLADELDEDSRRASKQLLDLVQIPKDSEPYWQFCQCIKGITIDPPGGDILIHAHFGEDVLQGRYDLSTTTFLQFFAEKVAKINMERVRVAPFLGSLARKRLGVRVSVPRELRRDSISHTFYFEDDMGRNQSKATSAAERFLRSYPELSPNNESLAPTQKGSASHASQPPPSKASSDLTSQAHEATIPTKRDLEPRYPDEETRIASKAYQDALECRDRLRAEGVVGSALEAALNEVSIAKRALREGRELMPGKVLRERYLILDRIGRGGFATVWKAKDRHTGTVAAIKVLHGHCAHDRTQRERFKVGIREMSRLVHPHVVRVLESYQVDGGYPLPEGDVDGGWHYFVMEYLEGGDLNHAIRTREISTDNVWRCLDGVASALEYAHSMGIIHRDVKPENILLALDGTAKLTDFDLARVAESSHGTKTGALGTAFYAAPEMHSSGVEIDARADVYSLAMTVVAAMRRQLWTWEEAYVHRQRVLSALGNRNLTGVLSKALAVKREQRYSSIREFWDALHSALSSQGRKRPETPIRQIAADGHLAELLLRAHRTSPTYKPACILAVLNALDAEEVSLDRLDPEAVFRRFDEIPEVASGMGWQPFFHLSTDGFWEFIKEGRKVNRHEFEKRKPATRRKLLQKVDFAVIPDAHKAWWVDAAERSALRRTVLAMLGRHTPESDHVNTPSESAGSDTTATSPVPTGVLVKALIKGPP